MNIFGNLLIGPLLVRLGGFVRYIYGTIIRKVGFSQSRYYSLREYIHGSENLKDEHWEKGASHEFVNRVVGILALVTICLLIIYFNDFFQ